MVLHSQQEPEQLAMLAKTSQENKEIKETKAKKLKLQELITAIQNAGKYEKNSKGIYYTNGNYEAFAPPGETGRCR